jgi:hypothetical protein
VNGGVRPINGGSVLGNLGRRSRHKLEETRFFLDRVKDSHFEIAQHLADESPPVPKFLYYLSAFVSSARSIAWVMRSEYSAVPGWERWFEGEEQLAEEQELLESFTNLRNANEKQGKLVATWGPTFAPLPAEGPEALPEQDRGKPRYHMTIVAVDDEDNPDAKIEMLSYVDKVVWRSPELGDRDLLAACDRYFRMLELLVKKCERVFVPGK